MFGLGSAQGSRGWLTSVLDLGFDSYRLGLTQAEERLSFVPGQLGWKLGSSRISSDLGSVGTHCLAGSLTRLVQISLVRGSAQLSSARLSSAQLEAQLG